MRNPYDAIGRLGLLLAVLGAVNWLLVGLFEWNLVAWIFTQSGTQPVDSIGERIAYVVVGIGGVLAIPMLAATLASVRGRDIRADEDGRRGRVSTSSASDNELAFYYGAPKEARAPERPNLAVASSAAGSATPGSDRDLSYGRVEEADDEHGESTRESRAA